MPAKPHTPADPFAEPYNPVPFNDGPLQVMVAEEIPSDGMSLDVEPYLRDVIVGINPITNDPIIERRFTPETKKQYLMDSPKVPVMIPPDTLDEMQNPSGRWELPVTWKGIIVKVPKCRPAQVPYPIACILADRAEPLRTTQAKQKGIYVTEISDGGRGPEIKMG